MSKCSKCKPNKPCSWHQIGSSDKADDRANNGYLMTKVLKNRRLKENERT